VKPRTRLATLCAALNEAGAHYLVVGAQAFILWARPRSTRDCDFLIEPTVENARRVLGALEAVGFWLRDESAEELATRPVTILSDPFFRVDILTVAWSVHYPEARARATVFTVEGVSIPTISLDDLIASKRTGRLQDAADIEVLEEIRRLRGAM
jgi:predicted nucleotidyltransferase